MIADLFTYKSSRKEQWFLYGIDVTPNHWKKTLRFYYFSRSYEEGAMTETQLAKLPFKYHIEENKRSGMPFLKRLPSPTHSKT